MRVVNSCILELREYAGKRIVCQIKSDCSTNGEVDRQGFHWLEKRHWQKFDKIFEQLVFNLSDKTRSRNKRVEKKFKLHDEIEVQVTNSSTSLQTLLDCLGYIELEKKEKTLAFDIWFRQGEKKKCTNQNPEILSNVEHYCSIEDFEYQPQPVSSILISNDSSSLSYVPSKIGNKSSDFDKAQPNIVGLDDDDRYSPKLPSEYASPVYTPKRISKENNIFANSSEEDDDNADVNKFTKSEVLTTTTAHACFADEKITIISTSSEQQDSSANVHLIQSGEVKALEKNIRTRRQYHQQNEQSKHPQKEEKKNKKCQIVAEDESQTEFPSIIKEAKESQDDNIDLEKYVKRRNDKAMKISANKEKQTAEINSLQLKTDSLSHNQHNELRRSNRSPVKNVRYKDDSRHTKSTLTNKKSSKLVSKTMQECFGSDAESDDFVDKTPIKTTPNLQLGSAHLSSSVKKRKRDDKDKKDCRQEKQSMSKWLSKKKPEELVISPKKASKTAKSSVKETKTGQTKSGIIKRIVYPTPEEIANNERREKEQMKVNRKMKVLLEDLIQAPKKVEILSLNFMSAEEILNTFPKYKAHLDVIFNDLRSKSKVTGYNGINHYSVIELLDNEKQLKIMNKLGEVYENESDGTSMYSSLFANALMPEWLVNIFKDKYKFSHFEAVQRLHDQQQYLQYMDVDDHH